MLKKYSKEKSTKQLAASTPQWQTVNESVDRIHSAVGQDSEQQGVLKVGEKNTKSCHLVQVDLPCQVLDLTIRIIFCWNKGVAHSFQSDGNDFFQR